MEQPLNSVATAIATRMKNAADARKIRVYEESFIGANEVFASEDSRAVAQFVRDNGGYNSCLMMDAGLFITFPDGQYLRQGQTARNQWIEANS